ncbi:MAG: hypothetical protein WC637_00255 [Victivallales bacterium]|jgi:hypothetical protein
MTIEIDKISTSGAVPEVIEVYRLLKRYKEDPARVDWERDVYKRGWDVAFGKQDAMWTEDEKQAMTDKKQIPIAINDCAKGIQGSCAIATANKPGIQVKPIGSSDLYVSELIKRAFDFGWGQNDGNAVIFEGVLESKVGSCGWFDVYWDESKITKWSTGKIVIKSDDPLEYYFDKKSKRPDKRDSHIIKAHLITRNYAKDNYDVTDDDLDFKPVSQDEEPGKSSAGSPGEDEYARMESEKAAKDTRSDEPGEDEKADVWEIEAWLIKKIKTFCLYSIDDRTGELNKFEFKTRKEAENALLKLHEIKQGMAIAQSQQDGIEPQVFTIEDVGKIKEIRLEKRVQRIIVGKKLISEEANPYGTDSDGDPVVPKIPIPHDRSASGFFVGPTYRAIEITRSRNKGRMQAKYILTQNLTAPIVRTEGSKWLRDKVHGDELVVDKGVPFRPFRLLPGATTGELMAMDQRDEIAINDEYDMSDVMKGKLPPGADSGKVVIALQDQAGMMSTPFIGQRVEGCIVKIAKVMLAIMLKHWTRQMWERLIEPDERTTWQPDKEKKINQDTGEPEAPPPDEISLKWEQALELIRPADPTKPPGIELDELDIKITAGSTMPTNRMAKSMMAIEKVNAGIYDAEAALDYDDDPNKERIIARMRQKEQAMMQAGMMKGAK